MSRARLRGLMSLQSSCGVDVVLITPKNLDEYIVEPLHQDYERLSLVHRSDYLRAYFMHHHGGGYSDIKPGLNSWRESFKCLGENYILGYREVGRWAVAPCYSKPGLRSKLEKKWNSLVGCGAFICQPKTEFTREWLGEVEDTITLKRLALRAFPGNVMGDNPGYPLQWTEILGDIFHPLILKYGDYVVQDDRVKPDFNKTYR